MSFELREHTADIAVEATGATLAAVFAAVADGLAAAHCEDIPDTGDRFTIEETAENREALLFDVLDRLIYERDVRNVLPTDHEFTIEQRGDEWSATGSARGVPLAGLAAREIKAVTYSEMVLEETAEGWHAYVVFDV
ncbi:MAG: archease [Halobacteriales archaeon]